MDTIRDRFLTEKMGKCWHEPVWMETPMDYGCPKCYHKSPFLIGSLWKNMNFSTPDGFFMLWEKAKVKSWFVHFLTTKCELPFNNLTPRFTTDKEVILNTFLRVNLVNPDKFANAVYGYLQAHPEFDLQEEKL